MSTNYSDNDISFSDVDEWFAEDESSSDSVESLFHNWSELCHETILKSRCLQLVEALDIHEKEALFESFMTKVLPALERGKYGINLNTTYPDRVSVWHLFNLACFEHSYTSYEDLSLDFILTVAVEQARKTLLKLLDEMSYVVQPARDTEIIHR